MYWVLVLGLQYSCVLGFPNTCRSFCNFPNTIKYYTISKKMITKTIKEQKKNMRKTEHDAEEEEEERI